MNNNSFSVLFTFFVFRRYLVKRILRSRSDHQLLNSSEKKSNLNATDIGKEFVNKFNDLFELKKCEKKLVDVSQKGQSLLRDSIETLKNPLSKWFLENKVPDRQMKQIQSEKKLQFI